MLLNLLIQAFYRASHKASEIVRSHYARFASLFSKTEIMVPGFYHAVHGYASPGNGTAWSKLSTFTIFGTQLALNLESQRGQIRKGACLFCTSDIQLATFESSQQQTSSRGLVWPRAFSQYHTIPGLLRVCRGSISKPQPRRHPFCHSPEGIPCHLKQIPVGCFPCGTVSDPVNAHAVPCISKQF